MNAEIYDVCLYPWYYHRMQRNGSITNSIKSKNIIDVIRIATFYYNDYVINSTNLRKRLLERLMRSVYAKLHQIKNCSLDEQQKVIQCINENIKIFCIAPKFKYKFFTFIMKIFGIDTAIKFLNII